MAGSHRVPPGAGAVERKAGQAMSEPRQAAKTPGWRAPRKGTPEYELVIAAIEVAS